MDKPSFGLADPSRHWRQRIDDGLAHNLGLVIAKAVRGQLMAGVPSRDILRQAALFAVRNRDGWGIGATILTALGNLLPRCRRKRPISPVPRYPARRRRLRRRGAAPGARAAREPARTCHSPAMAAALDRRAPSRSRRTHAAHRHRQRRLAGCAGDLLFAVATDRAFADGGHSLDFINKACECLDLIGWEHASAVLPSVVGQMVSARGAEETTAWRHPVDLVALCGEAAAECRACSRTPAAPSHGRIMRSFPGPAWR